MRERLARALSEGVALVLVAAVVGIVANHFSRRPAPLGRGATRIPVISTLGLAHARALYDARSMAFVDARERGAFQAGHIPRAFSVPRGRVAESAAALPPAGGLVVYCDTPDGAAAREVAAELAARGLGNLYVFPGGWREWTRAGFPTE